MSCYPFPDFGGGSYQATYGTSSYHGLQTKLEQQFSHGLTFLLTCTWAKTMTDAGDLLNGGSTGGLRAYAVPGLGPKFDYALADFDLRNVVHFSGSYDLPFGKDKQFMNQGGVANQVLGGWSINWLAPLQGGQPINFGCHSGTTSGLGCNDILVPGQSPKLGIKVENAGRISRTFLDRKPVCIFASVPVGRNTGSAHPDYRIGAQLRCFERGRGAGQQTRANRGTGIPQA